MLHNTLEDSHRTGLTVRQLHIDLSQGFARHWNGNDPFRTAFANAMSMSFPVGEQFFIDTIKVGEEHLPQVPENENLRAELRKFIGQEATHRHIHKIYNAQLERQGYRNHWELRVQRRIASERRKMQRLGFSQIYLHELAITCAVEHLTAILGDVTLSRQGQLIDWFLNAQEPLNILWRWHAAEEAEHRCLAFDLYLRLGGTHPMRMTWFRRFLMLLAYDLTLQIINNLWRDGSWKHLGTWRCGLHFLCSKHGLIRSTWSDLLRYRRTDFHPAQLGDNAASMIWLNANQHHWTEVAPLHRTL